MIKNGLNFKFTSTLKTRRIGEVIIEWKNPMLFNLCHSSFSLYPGKRDVISVEKIFLQTASFVSKSTLATRILSTYTFPDLDTEIRGLNAALSSVLFLKSLTAKEIG